MLKTTTEPTTGLKVTSHTLVYQTERGPQFIDITERVAELVAESGIETGFAVVFSKHTTAAITINENEPGLVADLEALLHRMLPHDHPYDHNVDHPTEDGEVPNGHSHCQHVFLGTSENIPINGGRMSFGKWQRLFLVELDRGREREVVVQLLGQ
ncbi:MAG: secondary thiamine-phosphate synthase enzyme YjbQ [Chloroflexota bacterium]